ncbi:MAG: Zn-dependent hydrolase [Anaerolineales bacterium]|nr:Zn-dependent hydrolase [Anaerolineales bacterium]
MTTLTINAARFLGDFEALSRIGATSQGGVNRPGLSQAHLESREWFRQCLSEAGLEFHVDSAGNHSAIFRQGGASKTLLLGSHLDSVPYGGRFDGTLGVVAALEVLRTIKEAGLHLPYHLEAIDFTDEESYHLDYFGSRALAGFTTPEELKTPISGRGKFEAGLALAGLSEAGILSARRDPASLAGYLELHIEQGPKLTSAHMQVGVVIAITGIRSFHLLFHGKTSHAGTTPMDDRQDAGLGASAFLLAAREIAMSKTPDCVANVGNMQFNPGVLNVIPGLVETALEIRSINEPSTDILEAALLKQAQIEAERFRLSLEIKPHLRVLPIHMDTHVRSLLIESAQALGLRYMEMPSGAGHDAQILAQVTKAGMIFVPSVGGISHTPLEYTKEEDCVNGANVLLGAALRMAGN